MVKIDDYKEYIWVLTLIGGILALISIITPIATNVVSSTLTFYCWTWGILSVGQQVSVVLNSNSVLLFIGLLGAFLIIIALSIIIITIYKMRKNDIKTNIIGPSWLISGFLIIGGLIISIIGLNSYILSGYIPNFGVFGQVIAAIMVLLGGFLYMKETPRK